MLIFYRLAEEELAGLLEDAKGLVENLGGDEFRFPPVPDGAVANCPCPRCQELSAPTQPAGPQLVASHGSPPCC